MIILKGHRNPARAVGVGLAGAVLGALALSVPQTPLVAHPSCAVGQPYRPVAKAFRHVVQAKPSVRTASRTETQWTGQLILKDLRFIRWPKKQAKPRSLTIDFDFTAEASCDWYPDLFHKFFVLDMADGQWTVVASYEPAGLAALTAAKPLR